MSVSFRPPDEMTPADYLNELSCLLAHGLVRLCRRWLRSRPIDSPAIPSSMEFLPEYDLRTAPN